MIQPGPQGNNKSAEQCLPGLAHRHAEGPLAAQDFLVEALPTPISQTVLCFQFTCTQFLMGSLSRYVEATFIGIMSVCIRTYIRQSHSTINKTPIRAFL